MAMTTPNGMDDRTAIRERTDPISPRQRPFQLRLRTFLDAFAPGPPFHRRKPRKPMGLPLDVNSIAQIPFKNPSCFEDDQQDDDSEPPGAIRKAKLRIQTIRRKNASQKPLQQGSKGSRAVSMMSIANGAAIGMALLSLSTLELAMMATAASQCPGKRKKPDWSMWPIKEGNIPKSVLRALSQGSCNEIPSRCQLAKLFAPKPKKRQKTREGEWNKVQIAPNLHGTPQRAPPQHLGAGRSFFQRTNPHRDLKDEGKISDKMAEADSGPERYIRDLQRLVDENPMIIEDLQRLSNGSSDLVKHVLQLNQISNAKLDIDGNCRHNGVTIGLYFGCKGKIPGTLENSELQQEIFKTSFPSVKTMKSISSERKRCSQEPSSCHVQDYKSRGGTARNRRQLSTSNSQRNSDLQIEGFFQHRNRGDSKGYENEASKKQTKTQSQKSVDYIKIASKDFYNMNADVKAEAHAIVMEIEGEISEIPTQRAELEEHVSCSPKKYTSFFNVCFHEQAKEECKGMQPSWNSYGHSQPQPKTYLGDGPIGDDPTRRSGNQIPAQGNDTVDSQPDGRRSQEPSPEQKGRHEEDDLGPLGLESKRLSKITLQGGGGGAVLTAKILSYLQTRERHVLSRVCRLWASCIAFSLTYHLDVSNHYKLTDDHFRRIVGKYQRLEKINITGCTRLSDQSLQTVAKTNQESISCLNVSRVPLISDFGLKQLAICGNLERLKVAMCNKVTSKGVDMLAKNCPKLVPPVIMPKLTRQRGYYWMHTSRRPGDGVEASAFFGFAGFTATTTAGCEDGGSSGIPRGIPSARPPPLCLKRSLSISSDATDFSLPVGTPY